jgi:four helix bundle protein
MNQDARIMNQETQKIKSFTDLVAWQEAHSLTLMIYCVTKAFPEDERFGLTSQMRRASVSMTSNIAEGFSRYTYADKGHFYSMALGSNTELQNQMLLAKDLSYLNEGKFKELAYQSVMVNKLLNGLIKKSKVTS